MANVKINGTLLEYNERGEGEPVVFVHGGIIDLRSWTGQMEAFGSRFRSVALSCRHFHPNPAVPDGADVPLETMAEDLVSFLRLLDLSPAHLVGSSSGAYVCLLLARKEPALVRTLTLAEPPVLPLLGVTVPPSPLEMLRLLIRSPGTALMVARFGATGIGPAMKAFERGDDEKGMRIFVRAALGREAAAKLDEATRRQTLDNARTFHAQLRAGLPAFSEADARGIDVPTLLVTGEHSNPVHHRVTDRLERFMPRVERIDMRDASHLMYYDRPEAFNRAVLTFLAGYQAVPAE